MVDRAAVARHAFADPAERAWLEGLLWPLVGARVAAFREAALAADPPPAAAVVETPLLFEAGLDGLYDATVAVVADEPVRAAAGRRARPRAPSTSAPRGSSPRTRRPSARTFVVANSGTVEDLERQLADVLGTLSGQCP